jgi:hypothetical protein
VVLNTLFVKTAMMPLAHNDLLDDLLEDNCEVALEKEYNRALHSGEKSDNSRC